jgi:hypothetical protein
MGAQENNHQQVSWLPLERDDGWSLVGLRLLT